jgi:hypothetical protein
MTPRYGRLVLLRPQNPAHSPIPLRWADAKSTDTDWYWLDLTEWLPVGDDIDLPTVTAELIAGDTNAPVVSNVSVDTGTVTATVVPGIPYTSTGPRISAQISGGTPGNDYAFEVAWIDAQSRSLTRTVMLKII